MGRTGSGGRRWRALGWLLLGAAAACAGIPACNEAVAPTPPKSVNHKPRTYLLVQADSLHPAFYKIHLNWYGTDADGRVVSYKWRWTCLEAPGGCSLDSAGVTTKLEETFVLPVPRGTASYEFQVAAVDDDGAIDSLPPTQMFRLYNTSPSVGFQSGGVPDSLTLPAVTFYVKAADADTTADPRDHDFGAGLNHYLAWLDGARDLAKAVPIAKGSISFGLPDFGGSYGTRTVTIRSVDDGGAVSDSIQYTWRVTPPPDQGILLVDDCTGPTSPRSDQSYLNVLTAGAPGRFVTLEIRKLPHLSQEDLEANLSLLDRIVWYTDADINTSGALALARQGLLDLLEVRHGRVFLCGGSAFGTGSAFGDEERRFRNLFGIDSVFAWPDGNTNFEWNQDDAVDAHVQTAVPVIKMRSLGNTMEIFTLRNDGVTRALYDYPPGTFHRRREIDRVPVRFDSDVEVDLGVYHEVVGGARVAYVSFPMGLPINLIDGSPGDNESEIREILRLEGILGP